MSQKSFRDLFLENILNFLWRQWSALGVLGEARTKDPWALDPEPMLLFTLEMGRYEPRLFDEVMDWLVVNGKWIDIQRLRGILREKEAIARNLVGAVAEFLTKEADERKWRNHIEEIEKPVWIDWIALYSALFTVWTAMNEISKDEISDYMRSSRLRDSLELVGNEFSRSGLDIPPVPGTDVRPEEFEKAFEAFIIKVFGAR